MRTSAALRTAIVTLSSAACFALASLAACSDGVAPATPPPATPPDAAVLTCPAPFAECDGVPNTICETRLDDDPKSCGACGKTCGTTGPHQIATCRAAQCGVACAEGFSDCDGDPSNGCEGIVGLCGVTTIVTTLSAPMGLAVDDTWIYYGSRGTPPAYLDGVLYKAPKGGGGLPTILATGLNRPLNLVVDDERVYWTNGGRTDSADGSVESIRKDGTARITYATGQQRPGNPLVVGDKLFWTVREQPTGRIVWAHLDGADPSPTTIVTGVANATDLQLAGGALVWTASGLEPDGKDPVVERALADGSSRATLAKGIAGPAFQIGVGATAIYVGAADGNVRRIPLDLTPVTVLAGGLSGIQEVLLDGATVYATAGGSRRVYAIAANGTTTELASGLSFPSYLARDAEYIYFTDGPLSGAATIRRVKKR